VTVAAPAHPRDRRTVRGSWFVPDESPGELGEREVWIDEAALDMYARGDAEPAVTVRPGPDESLVGASVRFGSYPGLDAPVVYTVICRRWSQANDGRPCYVLAFPDLPSAARERPDGRACT
jgi:hypothetical protein